MSSGSPRGLQSDSYQYYQSLTGDHMIKTKSIQWLSFLCSLILFLVACEYDGPTAVWDPDEKGKPDPKITAIVPDGTEFSTEMEIRFIGENFSPESAGNAVYFENEIAEIISSSENEIVCARPRITGDSLTIKVAVSGAYSLATFKPYRLESLFGFFGRFIVTDKVYTIALDGDENLYAMTQLNTVYVVRSDGEKTVYGTTTFGNSSDMKMGPGGYLYIMTKFRAMTKLHRIPPGGGETEEFALMPKRASFFDFDKNGNIYAAGSETGVFVVDQMANVSAVGDMADFDVRSIRIFADCVYIAGYYTGQRTDVPQAGVYRCPITSPEGDLADVQPVYDWATNGEYSETEILALTFAQDGEIYIGTDHAVNPILVVSPDSSSTPLYPGILVPSTEHLVWGNGTDLYMNRGDRAGDFDAERVLKIRMTKTGAPYYGRQ
jgi:hypothetical protein